MTTTTVFPEEKTTGVQVVAIGVKHTTRDEIRILRRHQQFPGAGKTSREIPTLQKGFMRENGPMKAIHDRIQPLHQGGGTGRESDKLRT